MTGRRWTPVSALRQREQSLALKLLRAREVVMQGFRPILREFDLTEQQWRVIRVLNELGSLDAGTLALESSILAPSLSRILPVLERRGLIRRKLEAGDHRRTAITLTQKGKALFEALIVKSQAIYQRIGEMLGDETVEDLIQILNRVIAALGNDGVSSGN